MFKFLRISAIALGLVLMLPAMALADNGATGMGMGINVQTNIGSQSSENAGSLRLNNRSFAGTVVSVSGTTINITEKDSTALAVDASSAKVLRKFGATMLISDIQAGDSLAIIGTLNGSALTAKTIRDMSQQQRNATFSGSVVSISGSSFLMKAKERANQTVNFNSSTVFTKNGQTDTSSDLIVLENILVSGVWDSTNNIVTASKVNIVMPTMFVTGTVSSISGTTINLIGKNSTTYVVDASNAKLVRRFGAALLITDIQAGDSLQVSGTVLGANVTAKTIRDNSLQAHNGTFVGSITAINGTSSFTLQSKERGSQTINVSSATVYKVGSVAGSFASLAVGQTVTASGVWDRTNSNVTATRVTVKVNRINLTGTLQSINGAALVVLGKDNTSTTVDASNAKFIGKNGVAATISVFQVNDKVQVRGQQTSGSTTVVASSVRDLNLTTNSNIHMETPPQEPKLTPLIQGH